VLAAFDLALDGLADKFGPVFLLAQKRSDAVECPGREFRAHHVMPPLFAPHARLNSNTLAWSHHFRVSVIDDNGYSIYNRYSIFFKCREVAMNALVTIERLALPVELTAPLRLAADFARASKAPATQAAYGSDFRIFEVWCAARGISALPATAESLCAFLADEAAAGKRASTLGRRLAAIRYFHRAAGCDTPTSDEKVKAVLSGIRRTIGAAPVRKKAATADITIAMAATGTSLRALRDRAVLLLGFAGAFRRSELVALDVEDIEDVPEGLLITIRRSKTDQEGQGRKVAIPRGEIACPVAAVKA
jgi:hypothetical protein